MPNVACGICVNILTRTTFHQLQLKCDDDENINFDHTGRLTLGDSVGDGELAATGCDDVDNDHDNCNLSNDCTDEDDKW